MNIALILDSENDQILFDENKVNYKFSHFSFDEKMSTQYDCFVVYANLNRNVRSRRIGLQIIEELRRDYFIKSPIIVYSFESTETLATENPVITSKGICFLRLPFYGKDLINQINLIKDNQLTNNELIEIVKEYCKPDEKWSAEIHEIAGLIKTVLKGDADLLFSQSDELIKSQIEEKLKELIKSIKFYSGTKHEKLTYNLEKISTSKKSSVAELNTSLQELSDSIKGKITNENWKEEFERLPKCPPKGYSKILVADDEPLPFLINILRNEFNYEVLDQAMFSTDAVKILEKEKPSIVLSDYYFKESKYKKPDKDVGSAFMKKALLYEIGSSIQSKKPIVAAISKVSLDRENELWSGVVDCSGPLYATSPEFIHYQIWQEAISRGIKEPEKINGQVFTAEMHCRQRLSPIKNEIPQTIRQWKYFRKTVKETLNSLRSVVCKSKSEDAIILSSLIKTLSPYSTAKTFSLNQVKDIYARIEVDHEKARKSEPSEANTLIRDILHGQIDQFYKIVNTVQTMRRIISEVAKNLIDLPDYMDLGRHLKETVENFDENKDLLPYLDSLKPILNKIIKKIPNIPVKSSQEQIESASPAKYNIISIEDNQVWADTVKNAVERLKSGFSGVAEINYRPCDNTSQALKEFTEISKSNKGSKTIAIVDICLPNEKGGIPQRKYGINLLEELSAYKNNFLKFVFSTKTSISDIIELGKAGIPNRRFIAKDNRAEDSIVERLAEIIQKKDKYFVHVKMEEKHNDVVKIFINNLLINFPDLLKATFFALFELTSSARGGRTRFNALEIYQSRPIHINEAQKKKFEEKRKKNAENKITANKGQVFDEKEVIQKDIYEIRKNIAETFQANNLYIDDKDLIRTVLDREAEDYLYELNAELPPYILEGVDDEDDEEAIEDEEVKTSFGVLVIQEDFEVREKIVSSFKNCQKVQEVKSAISNAAEILKTFYPDVVCLSLENIAYLPEIKKSLPNQKFGILLTVSKQEKDEKGLAQQVIDLDVPFANLVLMTEKDWERNLITKFDNEILRVFHGEINPTANISGEPKIVIKSESQLENGVIKLIVDGKDFKMNRSPVSKILGFLLRNPKTLISFQKLKSEVLNDSKPVTRDDKRNWTRRIRDQIQEEWLNTGDREKAMEILQSSEDGLILNVQILKSQI